MRMSSNWEIEEEEVFGEDAEFGQPLESLLESSFDVEARAIVGSARRRSSSSRSSAKALAKKLKRRVKQNATLTAKLESARSQLVVEKSRSADAGVELASVKATLRALRDEVARQRAERQHERFQAREHRARMASELSDAHAALQMSRGSVAMLHADIDSLRAQRVSREEEWSEERTRRDDETKQVEARHHAEIEAAVVRERAAAAAETARLQEELHAAVENSHGGDVAEIMKRSKQKNNERVAELAAQLDELRSSARVAAEEHESELKRVEEDAIASVQRVEDEGRASLQRAQESAEVKQKLTTARHAGGSWMRAIAAKKAQRRALETEHATAAAREAEHAAASAKREADLVAEHEVELEALRAELESSVEGSDPHEAELRAKLTEEHAAREVAVKERHDALVEMQRARAAATAEIHAREAASAKAALEAHAADAAAGGSGRRGGGGGGSSGASKAPQFEGEVGAEWAESKRGGGAGAADSPTAFSLRRGDTLGGASVGGGIGSPTVRPLRPLIDGRQWVGTGGDALYAAGPTSRGGGAGDPRGSQLHRSRGRSSKGARATFASTFAMSPASKQQLVSDMLLFGNTAQRSSDASFAMDDAEVKGSGGEVNVREARRLTVVVARAVIDALRQLQRMCTGEPKPLVRTIVESRIKAICGARSALAKPLAALDRVQLDEELRSAGGASRGGRAQRREDDPDGAMLERVASLWVEQRRLRSSRHSRLRHDHPDDVRSERGAGGSGTVSSSLTRSSNRPVQQHSKKGGSPLHSAAWTLAESAPNPIMCGLYDEEDEEDVGRSSANFVASVQRRTARRVGAGAERLAADFSRLLHVPPQRLCCSPLDIGVSTKRGGVAQYSERPTAPQLEEYIWHCLRMLAHCTRLERQHAIDGVAFAPRDIVPKLLGNYAEVSLTNICVSSFFSSLSRHVPPHSVFLRSPMHHYRQRKMLDMQLSSALIGYARLSHITAALNESAKRFGL